MDTNTNEKHKITNHDLCTTNSKVFGTIKECKYKNDSDSSTCLGNFCVSCGENLGEHNPRQYYIVLMIMIMKTNIFRLK